MGGICGWVGGAGAAELEPALERSVTEFDRSALRWSGEPGARLGDASLVGTSDRARTGDSTAVVYGTPGFRDEGLQRVAAQEGVASAVLSGFARHGTSTLQSMTGAFSLALVRSPGADATPEAFELWLATDRLGICPLYYTIGQEQVVFGSALSGIARALRGTLTVSAQCVFHYLYFHVIPGPRTVYDGVWRVAPGNVVKIHSGAARTEEYWRVKYERERSRVSVNDLKPNLMAALRSGLSEARAGSNEVACFLSGGTDSSTVAGLLSETPDGPAQTFSIGFEAEGYDEIEYARIAARHFGTVHHEYYVTPADIVSLVPRVAEVYGEPFGNSSVVPSYFCAHMAQQHGATRILGGDGGDELFGGNSRYAKQKLFAIYDDVPRWLRRLLEPALQVVPGGGVLPPIRKLRSYIEQARVAMPERLESYNLLRRLGYDNVLEPDFLASVNVDGPVEELRSVYNDATAAMLVNRMMALDLKLTLADNDLPKVNRMCELAGIDVGYPLLGTSLVEFSASVPAHLKVRGQKLRYFYKEALRDFLPVEVIEKSKHGFGLPFGRWLSSDPTLKSLAGDSLTTLKRRNIVRADLIDGLLGERLREHADYYGTLVWVLMMLELWYQNHVDAK